MIYLTPFDPVTRQCTGPSVDSGMASLNEVVLLMGEPVRPGRRMHTYADVAFSDFPLRIDAAVIMRDTAQHPPTE